MIDAGGLMAFWTLLDRLNLVRGATNAAVHPNGSGGYSSRGLPRAGRDLARGGDFLADWALLADPVTTALCGSNALPSVPAQWRFLIGADLGRIANSAQVNQSMLRRAWAAGAAPRGRPDHHRRRRHPGRTTSRRSMKNQ